MQQRKSRGLKKWSTIRDVVGFMGVMASLVFVGMEVSQNTAAIRGQTRQDLATLNQEWLILLSADPEFSDLSERAWGRVGGEVAPSEEYRAEMMMVLNLRRLENVFFQFQEGLVNETALGSYGFQTLDTTHARFREWWVDKNWRAAFHPDFVAFIEERDK